MDTPNLLQISTSRADHRSELANRKPDSTGSTSTFPAYATHELKNKKTSADRFLSLVVFVPRSTRHVWTTDNSLEKVGNRSPRAQHVVLAPLSKLRSTSALVLVLTASHRRFPIRPHSFHAGCTAYFVVGSNIEVLKQVEIVPLKVSAAS